MDPVVRALVTASLAGLSTILGAFAVFFQGKRERILSLSLGFAAGVMISVSLTDLYTNAHDSLVTALGRSPGTAAAVFSMIAGMAIAYGIDRFVPHEHQAGTPDKERVHKDLFRTSIVSSIAIALHNFPEGIATFMAAYSDPALGITIAVAISMHNIPEGIAVALPLYYATGSRRTAFKYTLISALSEPLGALLTFLLLRPFITDTLLGVVFGVIAGIMLYISLEELVPSSRQYGYRGLALFATLVGICIMPLSHAL